MSGLSLKNIDFQLKLFVYISPCAAVESAAGANSWPTDRMAEKGKTKLEMQCGIFRSFFSRGKTVTRTLTGLLAHYSLLAAYCSLAVCKAVHCIITVCLHLRCELRK